jgi:putative ubiquitin-RnfH superfamily antitoxin RatB of RatAB toxin-antitoxin module
MERPESLQVRVVYALPDEQVKGDRVEILRPLLIDPKQSRREAAERSRAAARSKR